VLELKSFEMFEQYFIEYVSIRNEVIYKAKDCSTAKDSSTTAAGLRKRLFK